MSDDPRSIAISLASAALLASAGTLAKSARAQSHEWANTPPPQPRATGSGAFVLERSREGITPEPDDDRDE